MIRQLSHDPPALRNPQPRPQGLLAFHRHIGKREDPGDEVDAIRYIYNLEQNKWKT